MVAFNDIISEQSTEDILSKNCCQSKLTSEIIYEKNKKNLAFEITYRIKDFYKDAVIFITGGTGFLGKALIEKLLRSCDDIRTVYVLVRPKKGLSSEQRLKELIKQQVFDRLHKDKPAIFDKLIYLAGDVILPNLGLNESDLKLLLDNVNIVFHSAATVKFNEGLKNAAELNALGTQRLLDICSKMKNLKSVVHVSTAYSNPSRNYVEEAVYAPTPPLDKDSLMKCFQLLPEKILNSLSEVLQGSHPNTYTLTKSIAEQIVSEYSTKIPICIIRPSIVTAAIKEPFPGWVDNIQGITGIMMEIGRGTISSILGDKDYVCDIIPVDTVVNTMLSAAWNTSFAWDKSIRVFNCTSGQINPITWEQLGFYTQKWARLYPSKYVMLYPNFSYRRSETIHKLYKYFLHFLPAYIIDIIMRIQGSKPIMVKIAKKFEIAVKTGKFFALHEWTFENNNQKFLVQNVKKAEDGNEFSCCITDLDYNDYIQNYMLGIRKYVLKDNLTTLAKAKRKLSILYWLKIFMQTFLAFCGCYFIFKKLIP